MAVITPNLSGDYHFFDAGYRGLDSAPITFVAPLPVDTSHSAWCCYDAEGRLHAFSALTTGGKTFIRHRRANLILPPFQLDHLISDGPGDGEPRAVFSGDGRGHMVFTRGLNVVYSTTDDDGDTWSDPVIMITGAKHPTINVGHDGEILAGAYQSGFFTTRIKQRGAVDFEAELPHLFSNLAGTQTAFMADDTFHFAPAPDAAGTWLGHFVVSGESNSSLWAWNNDIQSALRVG